MDLLREIQRRYENVPPSKYGLINILNFEYGGSFLYLDSILKIYFFLIRVLINKNYFNISFFISILFIYLSIFLQERRQVKDERKKKETKISPWRCSCKSHLVKEFQNTEHSRVLPDLSTNWSGAYKQVSLPYTT